MKTPIYITTMGLSAFLALTPTLAAEQTKLSVQGRMPTQEKRHVQSDASEQAKVQIAILLDTSNSMDGLIEQAKSQLWKVVNTFIDAKKNGEAAYVEVALYEYGKSSLSGEEHWVRKIQPLTRDLDEISKHLFALTTNGGQEYCGATIERAAMDLEWDSSDKIYKAIFIAGNEAFTQGPVSVSGSVAKAVTKGVVVNTIHCGSEKDGISGGWKNGAMLAEGAFLTINHDKVVAHIDAPQDEEILKLNEKLNKTYIAWGQRGAAKKMDQAIQDNNAITKGASGSHVQRVVSKSTSNYWNASWDLVDAVKQKDFDLTKVEKKQLPEEMQGMTPEQQKAYIAMVSKEREEIKKKIITLNRKRVAYVALIKKERAETAGDETLDEVITSTIRAQAEQKGYVFKQ